MPALQTMLSELNKLSIQDPDSPNNVNSALFEPGQTLSHAVQELNLDSKGLAGYLDKLPEGLQEALRALILSALTRESGLQPITFAWVPSYDYSLQLWDVSNTEKTAGGITVLLSSRYPDDEHPLART
jgi:hypothetical protein